MRRWFLVACLALTVGCLQPASRANATGLGAETDLGEGWELSFTPFAWILFIEGKQTLGSSSVDVDTNLFDIIDESDELYAWMSYQELRKDRLGIYGDMFWTKIKIKESAFRSINPIAGLNVSVVADAELWFDLAVLEPGAALEVFRWSSPGEQNDPAAFAPTTSVDVIGGARYWYMRPDLDLNVTAAINLPALGLTAVRARRIARSKTIDWWDPLIGLRVRHAPAPGHELVVKGDIGGFGVGSDFTWQAIAGYSFQTQLLGLEMTNFVGYRALHIDYEQGSGNRTIGFDLLFHGPMVGSTFRW